MLSCKIRSFDTALAIAFRVRCIDISDMFHFKINKKKSIIIGKEKTNASAGNRTRINCLEGSYADHYTTDAL